MRAAKRSHMSMTSKLVVLFLVVLNAGCATLATAALTGGDLEAVSHAAALDTAFLGAVSSAGLQHRVRQRNQHHYHVQQQAQQRQTVVVHVHNHIPGSANRQGAVPSTEDARQQEQRTPPPPPPIPEKRSREQVRTVIVSHMPELQRCQSLLPPAVGSSHRAYCRFRIQPDGAPVGIELRVHEPKPLRDCVEEVIGQWRFPEASMSTAVSLPLYWPASSPPMSTPE